MTQTTASAAPRPDRSAYVKGATFALITAALLASQEPLCGPAAQKLGTVQFVLINQIALTLAAPFLLTEAQARRDFAALFKSARELKHLAGMLAVGLAGLALYNLGLSRAHPVVVSAILNLSPFWAAMVARVLSGVRIPAGPVTFALALALAFAGAIAVAYSQSRVDGVAALLKGSWYFAIPVPIFTALSGSLIEVWFPKKRDSAALAASLLFSSGLMIPACALYLWLSGEGFNIDWRLAAMMTIGAILASAIGRLFYQHALRATGDDNGFVTMFFLLAPALAGAYSWALSTWIPALKFSPNPYYFAGLGVTALALFYFARRARAR